MRARFTALLALAGSLAAAPTAFSQAITETYTFAVGTAIPDNNSSGLVDSHSLASAITILGNVQLTLNIAGGFNGDYYAYLVHATAGGTGFAVLLNRVGATASNAFGYSDAGFSNVTFSGSAANDIHGYQSIMNPGGGALTGGTWAVDGRTTDPALVRDTDTRNALLSSFNGLDGSGTWSLYLADLGPAGTGTLTSWSLTIQSVPEPTTWAAGAAAVALVAGQAVRRRRIKPVVG